MLALICGANYWLQLNPLVSPGLQIARSGKFLLAGMGQEPRLGRWGRDRKARNGVLLHRLRAGRPSRE